ncbi:arylesterase [Mucilaginibacter arboris]|uniref:Arylesterase n=1 Tax=Mucilaginibacter arboris TaxID=2682090 RepID=A0A7K1SXG6_9SPHI|nr:arylesterase [Mucilaginibacter arboris]MVN21938.1 arylesterase [Mucilaginibacter arboris]
MQKVFPFLSLILIFIFCGCGNNARQNTNTEKDTVKEASAKSQQQKNILFFGNSLTAGYGLDDPDQAFPAIIQQNIDSLKLPYKVINGGLSGETSSDGKNRINWLLKQPVNIFVLELGANDGLRGIPVAETEVNLQSIIDQVKTKYPNVKMILTGMQVPPNMGGKYADDFKKIFPRLAKKNNMQLVPFLLENVAGIRELNQRDGIHPTAKGAKIVAQNVWVVLKGML